MPSFVRRLPSTFVMLSLSASAALAQAGGTLQPVQSTLNGIVLVFGSAQIVQFFQSAVGQ